jgi:hypothetical protein
LSCFRFKMRRINHPAHFLCSANRRTKAPQMSIHLNPRCLATSSTILFSSSFNFAFKANHSLQKFKRVLLLAQLSRRPVNSKKMVFVKSARQYGPLEIILKRGYIRAQDRAPEVDLILTHLNYRFIHDRKRTGKMAEN